jgi:inhibitor of KinA
MESNLPYTVYPCGEYAITIDFGNVIDETINHHVHLLFSRLKQQNIVGVKDVIPAYSTLTVVYDVVTIKKACPTDTAYNTIFKIIKDALSTAQQVVEETATTIKIPVCYDPLFASDLLEMAVQKNVKPQTIIEMHCSKTYRVFMLGFLPGFAYMGTVPEELETPRKNTPRTNVPAGSVGVAGKQTGIYPFESPGGWNIIGQTPQKMFDANRQRAVLLQPAQQVQFYPITSEEFYTIKAAQ